MPQPVFLEALARKAGAFPGFQCWMGARVTELVEEQRRGRRASRAGGTARSRSRSGPTWSWAPMVATRRSGAWAGSSTEYEHHDFDVIWFVVEPPPDWPKTIYFSVGKVPLADAAEVPEPDPGRASCSSRTTGGSWRQEGIAAVAERIRRLDPLFAAFAAGLRDFTPFFPLPAVILLVRDWARDGLLLIGDAAHTMSPAGAIGVNVALATAAVAAQEIYPKLGQGPIPREALARVQELRDAGRADAPRAPAPGGPGAAGIGQSATRSCDGSCSGRCRWPSARGCSRGSSVGCSSASPCRRSIPRSAFAPARPRPGEKPPESSCALVPRLARESLSRRRGPAPEPGFRSRAIGPCPIAGSGSRDRGWPLTPHLVLLYYFTSTV